MFMLVSGYALGANADLPVLSKGSASAGSI